MKNKTKSNIIKNKDCVLYAKAHIFPVGHENYGKRLFLDRGSLAYLEAKAAMGRLKSSAIGLEIPNLLATETIFLMPEYCAI